MAWRPNDLIVEGALAFNNAGSVKGTARFNGLDRPVKFDLTGCPPDLRGTLLIFHSTEARAERHISEFDIRPASEYMKGFALLQRGKFERIRTSANCLTLAWQSESNGRVCIEFDATFTHGAFANRRPRPHSFFAFSPVNASHLSNATCA
ncbi:MAG: hypothetical protein WBD55_06240 [Dehalococcoidia bacterium]